MRTNMLLWSYAVRRGTSWSVANKCAEGYWAPDQCAAECTTGRLYDRLYGRETRPLGWAVFPVYWLHCSPPFKWIAGGKSDKPSSHGSRRESRKHRFPFTPWNGRHNNRAHVDSNVFSSGRYLFDIEKKCRNLSENVTFLHKLHRITCDTTLNSLGQTFQPVRSHLNADKQHL